MAEAVYDVIIIGGAPAGLTAAIYTSREKLNTLLLEKAQCGGLVATTDLIENYPGFPEGAGGMQLMSKFKEQAQKFDTQILEMQEVIKITKEEKKIKVKTANNEYVAYVVIIASGSIPKRLNIPGEEEYRGRGVSYCATCDGPLFREKDVAIIGCGNSGLQEGEALLKYVKSVTFVEFLPEMTAAKILQERVQKNTKAHIFLNHQLLAINGEGLVNSITLKDRASSKKKTISVSGVFMYAGFVPNTKFLQGLVELDSAGYIITNEKMETSVPGVYAAGDIRAKEVRQISVACAEGTIAALSARDYIAAL